MQIVNRFRYPRGQPIERERDGLTHRPTDRSTRPKPKQRQHLQEQEKHKRFHTNATDNGPLVLRTPGNKRRFLTTKTHSLLPPLAPPKVFGSAATLHVSFFPGAAQECGMASSGMRDLEC